MDQQIYRQDIAAALLIILVGIAAFVLALDMPGNASMFPELVSVCLVVIGGLMIASSVAAMKRKKPAKGELIKAGTVRQPVIVFLLLVFYAAAVIYIGFYTSTVIMLAGYMYLLGIRKIKLILLADAAVMAFVYCLFTMWLAVPLPAGIFI